MLDSRLVRSKTSSASIVAHISGAPSRKNDRVRATSPPPPPNAALSSRRRAERTCRLRRRGGHLLPVVLLTLAGSCDPLLADPLGVVADAGFGVAVRASEVAVAPLSPRHRGGRSAAPGGSKVEEDGDLGGAVVVVAGVEDGLQKLVAGFLVEAGEQVQPHRRVGVVEVAEFGEVTDGAGDQRGGVVVGEGCVVQHVEHGHSAAWSAMAASAQSWSMMVLRRA